MSVSPGSFVFFPTSFIMVERENTPENGFYLGWKLAIVESPDVSRLISTVKTLYQKVAPPTSRYLKIWNTVCEQAQGKATQEDQGVLKDP